MILCQIADMFFWGLEAVFPSNASGGAEEGGLIVGHL